MLKQKLPISAEANYSLGSSIHLDSGKGTLKVVFRDNGSAAYFSALAATGGRYTELATLTVYTAANIEAQQSIPRFAGKLLTQIIWSAQGGQALLVVNHQPQAVFDFIARRSYCRAQAEVSGDLAPVRPWNQTDSQWHDDALKFF